MKPATTPIEYPPWRLQSPTARKADAVTDRQDNLRHAPIGTFAECTYGSSALKRIRRILGS